MALSRGTNLGPYEILEQIGAGGMGAVYKARDPRLGREVAIKVLPADRMTDPDRRRRFLQEARSASALNHPHIVTIHDIGETDGIDFIVMEYVAGRTLDHCIPREGMKPVDALKYAIPAAEALAAAHAAGIVHRDLKPANVIVSLTDTVKVLDFGLAKPTFVEAAAGDVTRTMVDASQDGAIVGTAAYMSPEQAEGHRVDARSDIFSFGAMLYEMLTGQKAFAGNTTVSTLAAVLRHEPVSARTLAPQTPRELERIVRRCLRKEPDRRFQTAADLKVALQEVLEDVQSGRLEEALPLAPDAPPRRNLWPLAIVGVVIVLAGVVWATWLLRGILLPRIPNYTFRRLTNDSGLTHNPALSPDGKLVAYESDRAGTGVTDIWVQQVSGGSAIRLSSCKLNCMQPSFSPDGSTIVYFSREGGGGIYLIPTLGGDPRRIAGATSIEGARPRFSPDGSKISFRYLADFRTGAINVVDPNGTQVHQFQNLFGESAYAWTPDSRGILTLGPIGADDFGWVINPLDGGQPVPTAVRRSNRSIGRRAMSPESWVGDRLIAATSDSFHSSLMAWRLTPAGMIVEPPRPLTQGSGSESGASQSADGRRIVFSAYTSENSGIWRVPLDAAAGRTAAEPVQVTQPPRSYFMPAPGTHAPMVAYVSLDGPIAMLWVRDVSSGKEHRIAERAVWPVLSADGKKLAFQQQTASGRSEVGRGPLYVANPEGDPAPRKVCDPCGQPYHFFGHDSKLLFDHGDSKSHEIDSVDLATGQTHLVLKHAKNPIFVPHLSADEKWISFTMVTGERGRRFYVAPFEPDKEIPESAWIQVLDGQNLERQPFWSPVGDMLYFLSDSDGFRCIWALRLDPATRQAAGDPFPVQHFHDSRYTLLPFTNPGYIGVSVSSDALYLSLYESRANVWLAEEMEPAAERKK